MREPTNETGVGPVNPRAPIGKNSVPLLDDAMHELKETDREAILLRYFENRPFAEVGAKLGLNENAARMRVERALEKLRDDFCQTRHHDGDGAGLRDFRQRGSTCARESGRDADDGFDCGRRNRNLHTFENYDRDKIKTRHQRARRGWRGNGVGGSTSSAGKTARGKRIAASANRATANRQRKSFKPSRSGMAIPNRCRMNNSTNC